VSPLDLTNTCPHIPHPTTECLRMQGYQGKRLVRASAIHGLAGSAAIMASTYKAYLGEGLGPLGDLLLPLKIPHPGKVHPPSSTLGTEPGERQYTSTPRSGELLLSACSAAAASCQFVGGLAALCTDVLSSLPDACNVSR